MKLTGLKKAIKDSGFPTLASYVDKNNTYTKKEFLNAHFYQETNEKALAIIKTEYQDVDLDDLAVAFFNTYVPMGNHFRTVIFESQSVEITKTRLTQLANNSALPEATDNAILAPEVIEALNLDKLFPVILAKGYAFKAIADDEVEGKWVLLFYKTKVPNFTQHLPLLSTLWQGVLDNNLPTLVTPEARDQFTKAYGALTENYNALGYALEYNPEKAKEVMKWNDRALVIQSLI